jgi:hypothetical protein
MLKSILVIILSTKNRKIAVYQLHFDKPLHICIVVVLYTILCPLIETTHSE